jgi:hypothetical protein
MTITVQASCRKCGHRLEVPITTRPAQVIICSNCYQLSVQEMKQRLEGYFDNILGK